MLGFCIEIEVNKRSYPFKRAVEYYKFVRRLYFLHHRLTDEREAFSLKHRQRKIPDTRFC
jgi:hypothetical protein